MPKITEDPNDPRLGWGQDEEPRPQQDVYLVLSEAERKKGFVRPYRDRYIHTVCGSETIMGQDIAETYARNPKFYGSTYCAKCMKHRPLSEFVWSLDNQPVGS